MSFFAGLEFHISQLSVCTSLLQTVLILSYKVNTTTTFNFCITGLLPVRPDLPKQKHWRWLKEV